MSKKSKIESRSQLHIPSVHFKANSCSLYNGIYINNSFKASVRAYVDKSVIYGTSNSVGLNTIDKHLATS